MEPQLVAADASGDGLSAQIIDALSRHVLTALAGVAVSRGYATQDQATAIMGGCMAVVAVVWSMRNKFSHAKAVAVALATPPPASHPLDQPE